MGNKYADDVVAAEPEPQELASLAAPSEYRKTGETWYRCGYLIAGGKPYMVNEHARTEEAAEKQARAVASRVRKELLQLGAPADVSWWTQKWRIEFPVEYSEARVEPIS